MNAFESITQQRRAANFDTGCTSFHYEMLSEEMSTSEWIECILSLNQKQYSLHQCIVEWASKMTLSHRIPKPDPFCLFLTGGAGVGKSHLVRNIVQTVNRIFAINNQVIKTMFLSVHPLELLHIIVQAIHVMQHFFCLSKQRKQMITYHCPLKNLLL